MDATNAVTLANSQTGADSDLYVARVGFDGTPESVWLYDGRGEELAPQLASSADGTALALAGYFDVTMPLGDQTFVNAGGPLDGYVVKLSAADGAVARHVNSTGFATVASTAFDATGNVAIAGRYCPVNGADDCEAYEVAVSCKLVAPVSSSSPTSSSALRCLIRRILARSSSTSSSPS